MSGSFWGRLSALEEKVEYLLRLVAALRDRVKQLEDQARSAQGG